MRKTNLIKEFVSKRAKVVGSLVPFFESTLKDLATVYWQTNRNSIYPATLFACGNGGSNAQAQHLVTELVVKFRKEVFPLPALCLGVDPNLVTATGNDLGFDYVFSRQLRSLGKLGDYLFCFTTSGSSQNIAEVLYEAKRMGVISAVFSSHDGLGRLLDKGAQWEYGCGVPSDDTAVIQEAHLIVTHLFCEYLELWRG